MNAGAWLSKAALCGGAAPQVMPGDIVPIGESRRPHYEVIAFSGDRVWIRDIRHGRDHVVPLGPCRTLVEVPGITGREHSKCN